MNAEFVYGVQPAAEALASGKEIERILVQRGSLSANLTTLLHDATQRNIPVVRVPLEKLNRVTKKNHQGVIVYLSPIAYASLDHLVNEAFTKGEMPFFLLLDRITDVRNFGAISRAAECAGVDAIVIPTKGAAQINSDAMRASAGALQHIPVCRTKSLLHTIRFLQESGIRVVACTEKASDTLYETDLSAPIAIIMGSEEDGISNELLTKADALAQIPMMGKINSLNVAVACGVAVFEARRQQA